MGYSYLAARLYLHLCTHFVFFSWQINSAAAAAFVHILRCSVVSTAHNCKRSWKYHQLNSHAAQLSPLPHQMLKGTAVCLSVLKAH